MRFASYLLPLFALVLASCSDAKGSVSGGDPRFDAATPPLPVVDSGPSGDGGTGDITWTGLYRDFFGSPPPGPGCSGTAGQCHGTAGDPGAGASLFTCGASKDDCFKGITSKDASLVDTGNPPGSGLITVIRHQQNGVTAGSMPKSPATYVFSADAVKRIEDWMSAGAQNN